MQDDQPAPPSNWSYNSDPEQPAPEPVSTQESVAWTASEFISHEKGPGWYMAFGLVTALLTFITFILTREVISTVVIIIAALAFGVFAGRQPRTLPYRVDSAGVHINEKTYGYEQFKSFALFQEGGIRSLSLLPMKRFMPPISLYFDPADEDKIASALSKYLPFEAREQDFTDRLMRHLRF